jgi:hypothetical protein
MPLLPYFGWVGSFLVAALLAANWCFSVPVAGSRPSDVPANQRINIRIHTDHKWPERVVFDTARSMPTPDAKPEAGSDLGSSETLVQAEHQPFGVFAAMAAIPVRRCFRPPCAAGRAAEQEASPLENNAPFQNRSHLAARKDLTFPSPPRKPQGKS